MFQVIITQQFYNWLLKKQDLLTFQRSEVEQAEVAPPSHCSYVLMILAQEGLLLNKLNSKKKLNHKQEAVHV